MTILWILREIYRKYCEKICYNNKYCKKNQEIRPDISIRLQNIVKTIKSSSMEQGEKQKESRNIIFEPA